MASFSDVSEAALRCPFPSAIHPSADAVEERTLTWLDACDLLAEPRTMRRARAARFGRLASRAFAWADPRVVQLASDWSAWLFVRDDQCDESGLGHDPVALASRGTAELAVLVRRAHPHDALSAALCELAGSMERIAPPGWTTRFAHSVHQHFDACVWEAANRARGTRPSVEEYVRMRRYTGGVLTCLDLCELGDGPELPLTLRVDSDFQRLVELTNDVVCWSNDVFSLEKERAQGDFHNLVLVLHAAGADLDAARTSAVRMHDEALDEFVRVRERLRTRDLGESARPFVEAMQTWMRANLDWSLESGRYVPSAA